MENQQKEQIKQAQEEASEAWKEHFAKKFYLSTPEEKITSMVLLSDYKASLENKLKQETELFGVMDTISDHNGKVYISKDQILELLNTCKPTN